MWGALVAAVLLIPASPAGAVGREFFGIVPTNTPSAAEFQTMGEARIGTYRFRINWANVQPTVGGDYDWSQVDAEVSEAALSGMELLPFAYGSPGYAADSPKTPPLASADAREGWQQFLTAAAERYGPGGEFWDEFELQNPDATPRPIKLWQIWNEVNSLSYYEPKPSPREYSRLLKISDAALSEADSRADILLAGMFGTPGRNQSIYSWKYLKRLYKIKGTRQHFDAIALHPYSPNLAGIKAQIELVRKQAKKVGRGRTPIWITELGWGSAGSNGHDLIKSRAGQKKMLRRSYNLILDRRRKWNVKRLFWFTWRDGDSDPIGVVCTWCSSAGLFDSSNAPKPAFDQLRRFTGGQ